MDAMLSSQDSHTDTNAAEFTRLNLSRAIMLSCQELVTLSTHLYAKHYALSCNSRANFLQVICSMLITCQTMTLVFILTRACVNSSFYLVEWGWSSQSYKLRESTKLRSSG